MQKNDKGQWLDPAKRTPLPTCKCGKFLGPMSDCIFKGLYGDANHLPIQ